MKRAKVIAGNWKLHHTVAESVALVRALRAELDETLAASRSANGPEVVVAPVATALHAVSTALEGSSIGLSAQNTYSEDSGAFTGELSPALLEDVGCHYCIVGHSERRQLFGETDAGVNAKVKALLAQGLVPIICVGETLDEREAGRTLDVVLPQVRAALDGIDPSAWGPGATRLLLAYEPIWAIGTGKTAAPDDAQEVHAAIRSDLAQQATGPLAQGARILYGGSVKPTNAAELLDQSDIDGALVGGASLTAESFVPIVQAAF